jgi:hypothetical protein
MHRYQWHWQYRVTDGYGTYYHIEVASTKFAAREQAIAACGSHAHIELVANWLQ